VGGGGGVVSPLNFLKLNEDFLRELFLKAGGKYSLHDAKIF
jgi:hypothetical protein